MLCICVFCQDQHPRALVEHALVYLRLIVSLCVSVSPESVLWQLHIPSEHCHFS